MRSRIEILGVEWQDDGVLSGSGLLILPSLELGWYFGPKRNRCWWRGQAEPQSRQWGRSQCGQRVDLRTKVGLVW